VYANVETGGQSKHYLTAQKNYFMKKIWIVCLSAGILIFISCHNNSTAPAPASSSGSPDSAANNGVLPPSASPSEATNSSVADTAYKSPDSNKIHKDTTGVNR
jgi:hypothetical protein